MFGLQQKRKKSASSDACLSAICMRFLALCLIQLMFFTLPTSAQQPKSFSCGSNLPEFTLGIKTQLSSKQLNSLCTCISSNLDEKSKATGTELANMSKSTKIDDNFMERLKIFSKEFDRALQLCGGYKL